MSPIAGYVNWVRTLFFLQQQISSMMTTGNGNGAASSPPFSASAASEGISGHDDSDMENHFKSGEYKKGPMPQRWRNLATQGFYQFSTLVSSSALVSDMAKLA